jgi:hypothetical protein
MKPRYIIQGSDNWHSRSGYQYERRNDGSSFERPAGEPSYLAGVLLLVAVFTIATLLIVAFTGGGQ